MRCYQDGLRSKFFALMLRHTSGVYTAVAIWDAALGW
jgi:hypothetical protein